MITNNISAGPKVVSTKKGWKDRSINSMDIDEAIAAHDSNGDGKIDEAELRDIVRALLDKKKEAHSQRMMLIILSIFVGLLAVSNIGTAYFAVHLQKEIQVSNQGVLVSSKDQKEIAVLGQGTVVSLTTEEAGKGCIPTIDLATLYDSLVTGSKTGISADTNGTIRGMDLFLDNSILNETHLCMSSSSNRMFCADLQDTSCLPEDSRRLMEETIPKEHHGKFQSASFHFLRKARQRGYTSKLEKLNTEADTVKNQGNVPTNHPELHALWTETLEERGIILHDQEQRKLAGGMFDGVYYDLLTTRSNWSIWGFIEAEGWTELSNGLYRR